MTITPVFMWLAAVIVIPYPPLSTILACLQVAALVFITVWAVAMEWASSYLEAHRKGSIEKSEGEE